MHFGLSVVLLFLIIVTHECVSAMLTYSASELYQLRRNDVTVSRSDRKSIFRHRLWCPRRARVLHQEFLQDHFLPVQRQLMFGFLNVRSINTKIEDVLELIRDRKIDVGGFSETWHDDESVAINRLRSAGFHVIDRPRPRISNDMLTNHGGVAIVASSIVQLRQITVQDPSSFELVCARVSSGQCTYVVVVLYRPGAAPVRQEFFDELSAVMDVLATYRDPVLFAGDFNIRLDRSDDPHAIQLRSLLDSYGFTLHPTGPTHQQGGTIDAVASLTDNGLSTGVDVIDVGLSDHSLLQWSVPSSTLPVLPTAVLVQSWKNLDINLLRFELSRSRLCQPEAWPDDTDDLAAMYTLVIKRNL